MTTTAPPRSAPALPAPPATRLRRPSWRDPRLVVGLLLVAVSVAAGSWVVSAAQAATPVWVARGTLTPGTVLGPQDVVLGEVRLGPAQLAAYLDAREPLPQDLVVHRTVAAGELVPRSALGPASSLEVQPVALSVAEPGSAVVEGAVVDVWLVPENGKDPRLVADGLTVSEVSRPSGTFTQGQTMVHVLVPTEELPAVLAATAADGAVRVVPVLGGS